MTKSDIATLRGLDTQLAIGVEDLPESACAFATPWIPEGRALHVALRERGTVICCPPVVLTEADGEVLGEFCATIPQIPAIEVDRDGHCEPDMRDCGEPVQASEGGWMDAGDIVCRRVRDGNLERFTLEFAVRLPYSCKNPGHWYRATVRATEFDLGRFAGALKRCFDTTVPTLPQPMTWRVGPTSLVGENVVVNLNRHRDDKGQLLVGEGEGAVFLFQVRGLLRDDVLQLIGLEPAIVGVGSRHGRLLVSARVAWNDRHNLPAQLASTVRAIRAGAQIEAFVGAPDQAFVAMIADEVGIDASWVDPIVALESARLAHLGFDLRRLRGLEMGGQCAFPDLGHIEGDSFLDEIENATFRQASTRWESCPPPSRPPVTHKPLRVTR